MKTTHIIHSGCVGLAVLAAACASTAGQICHECVKDPASTSWDYSFSLPQFDPAMGTLTAVHIKVTGRIDGLIRFESLDAAPATAKVTLAADLTLCEPGGVPILNVVLEDMETAELTEYDGVTDFGGTSGRTYDGLAAVNSESLSPVDLAPYIGTGMVDFNCKAIGKSTVSGPGNVVEQVSTRAGGLMTLCYVYDEAGDEGCTPGYWKNHLEDWAPTGYSPGDNFDATFGVSAFGLKLNLEGAATLKGGGIKALGRHAVAALLNASHPDVASPYTPDEVIAIVQRAVAAGAYEWGKDVLEKANELGCPL